MPMKDVVGVFKALSDPTRIRILLLLQDHDLCVCEIMYVLGMEQSRVSHQMRVLRHAGLVEDSREGRWIVYRIPEQARPLLEDLFAGALRADIEEATEVAADARKLKECLRENVRQVCKLPLAPGPCARPARAARTRGGAMIKKDEIKAGHER